MILFVGMKLKGSYTVKEIEDITGIPKTSIYRMMDEGRVKYFTIYKTRRIPYKEIQKILEKS